MTVSTNQKEGCVSELQATPLGVIMMEHEGNDYGGANGRGSDGDFSEGEGDHHQSSLSGLGEYIVSVTSTSYTM